MRNPWMPWLTGIPMRPRALSAGRSWGFDVARLLEDGTLERVANADRSAALALDWGDRCVAATRSALTSWSI